MFLRTKFLADDIQRGWDRLEELVSTRGRKFYGAVDPPTGEYWVCVERKETDDPAALGLESGTLPGGSYLRARLKGEPPAVYQKIGPAFEQLAQGTRADPTRPSIEFYRERNEIDLLLPVID
ncbi:MAG TPA: GyrI-like domain-containing protein [Candidatus Dormibacteraeota bacterium]|jgi:hypothetical protein|nr:GyrI-like domain-containing protein [Candidatus Dormibacteraeota bacterium]